MGTKKQLKVIKWVVVLFVLLAIPWPHKYMVSIPNLNSGGCGYYAYYVSGKVPGSEIVSLRGGMHYMVRTKWGYMDSRGLFLPPFVYFWAKGDIKTIKREELRLLLNEHSLWNKEFNLKDTSQITCL